MTDIVVTLYISPFQYELLLDISYMYICIYYYICIYPYIYVRDVYKDEINFNESFS